MIHRRPLEPRRGDAERGQLLVLFALTLTAIIAGTALIIDGGNLWAQQRIVQNASDSSAQAGAIVMAERFAGATAPSGGWDAKVLEKITENASANGITVTEAYYTDICGIPLTPSGTKAVDGSGLEDLAAAARVGTGIPSSSNTAPNCPNLTVGPPAGVMVFGTRDVQTFFAAAIGLTHFPVGTRATAVSGYLQGYCDASQSEACALLPITVPVNVSTCDGQNNVVNTGLAYVVGPIYRIPICGNGAGNVGWLDWSPPNGGTSELVCAILTPNNPSIDLPSWQYVTATGNTNGGGGQCGMSVQDAIRTYDGKVVTVPQFDYTCADTPDFALVDTSPPFGCPAPNGNGNGNGGGGQQQWYRMPSFAFFELCSPTDTGCVDQGTLHGAYIGGNNSAECDVGGNGATSCLVGRFVKKLDTGTVGAGVGGGVGGEKVVGVQLIR